MDIGVAWPLKEEPILHQFLDEVDIWNPEKEDPDCQGLCVD